MKIERIRSYEKFMGVKSEWNILLCRSGLNIPFLTHQWFDAWWSSFGGLNTMEILLFRDASGILSGIAPLMVSEESLRFIASHEVTDYCDFIFVPDKRDKFYDCLWDHISRNSNGWSRIELISIPDPSATLSELPRLAERHGYASRVNESEIVPKLPLPASIEKYLHSLSRKNRHELRRKIRKLDTLGNIHIRKIKEAEQLQDAVDGFISLHRASSREKREFWNSPGMTDFFHAFCRLFSLENWVEMTVLTSSDRLIAALLSFHYAETVYFYNIAYDKDYSVYSPGFSLFHHAIDQAIADQVKLVDFLRGREKYKYFFGAKESKIYSLKLKRIEKRS